MSRRPLSEDEKKIWQAVTKDVTELHTNSPLTSRPISKSHFEIHTPSNLKNTSFEISANYDFKDFKPSQNINTPQTPAPSLLNKDSNWLKKIRSRRARPEGKIDLHGMTQDQAYSALHHYIDGAIKRQKRLILVVTGKGGKRNITALNHYSDYENERGILRTQVPRWLSLGDLSHKVVSYYTANVDEGGEGAIYVVLKR